MPLHKILEPILPTSPQLGNKLDHVLSPTVPIAPSSRFSNSNLIDLSTSFDDDEEEQAANEEGERIAKRNLVTSKEKWPSEIITKSKKDVTIEEQQILEDEQKDIKEEEQVIEDEKQAIEDEEQVIEDEEQVIEDEEQAIEGEEQAIEGEEQTIEQEKLAIEDKEQIVEQEKQVVIQEAIASEQETRFNSTDDQDYKQEEQIATTTPTQPISYENSPTIHQYDNVLLIDTTIYKNKNKEESDSELEDGDEVQYKNSNSNNSVIRTTSRKDTNGESQEKLVEEKNDFTESIQVTTAIFKEETDNYALDTSFKKSTSSGSFRSKCIQVFRGIKMRTHSSDKVIKRNTCIYSLVKAILV
jgi:hypothetical protein